MGNPEDHVLDAIAELVDESIAHGPTDDYDRPYQERCELCGMTWHGLISAWGGCPGAHATPEERQRFLRGELATRRPSVLPEDPFAADWPDEYTELPPSMQFPRVDFTPLIEGFAELRERMHAWLATATPGDETTLTVTTWLPGDPLS